MLRSNCDSTLRIWMLIALRPCLAQRWLLQRGKERKTKEKSWIDCGKCAYRSFNRQKKCKTLLQFHPFLCIYYFASETISCFFCDTFYTLVVPRYRETEMKNYLSGQMTGRRNCSILTAVCWNNCWLPLVFWLSRNKRNKYEFVENCNEFHGNLQMQTQSVKSAPCRHHDLLCSRYRGHGALCTVSPHLFIKNY